MRQGVVGNPKRDPITGVLADQHLPSTDVTVEVGGKLPCNVKKDNIPP